MTIPTSQPGMSPSEQTEVQRASQLISEELNAAGISFGMVSSLGMTFVVATSDLEAGRARLAALEQRERFGFLLGTGLLSMTVKFQDAPKLRKGDRIEVWADLGPFNPFDAKSAPPSIDKPVRLISCTSVLDVPGRSRVTVLVDENEAKYLRQLAEHGNALTAMRLESCPVPQIIIQPRRLFR